MSLLLVLGGVRSGKSAHAERLVAETGLPVRYVGTAPAGLMADRIAGHVARRPAAWETVEAGAALAADALDDADGHGVLVDGLGPWLATALHEGRADPLAEIRTLASRAAARPEPTVVVAEDAGRGVLPPDAESRRWLDLLGEATQLLAAAADTVTLVVAGLPMRLGGQSPESQIPATECFGGSARPSMRLRGQSPESHGLREHGDEMVGPGMADHAVNVVAGGPPGWLRIALREALERDVATYPREDEAIAAVAALHGREPDEVVPTNGAAEALWLLPAALRPALAAVVHPVFTEAEAALHAHGVLVHRVLRDPAADFAIDPHAVPSEADLVVVGNPAAASGTLAPAQTLLALCRPGRTLVVDEAFMDMVPGETGSLAREAATGVIVVRSLTKALAIPGLRAGYALAPRDLAQRLRAVRPPWAANTLALAALSAAVQHPGELASVARQAQAQRQDLEERLGAAGIAHWKGAANFTLAEVGDGPAALARLHDAGIAVRPAASFPGLGSGHLRLTARTPPENARLVDTLAEVVAACA